MKYKEGKLWSEEIKWHKKMSPNEKGCYLCHDPNHIMKDCDYSLISIPKQENA